MRLPEVAVVQALNYFRLYKIASRLIPADCSFLW